MTTYTNNTLALSRAIGLDPQILHEFAENMARQMEAQTAAFAPALQAIQAAPAIQAFYPGGLYNRRDPESGERLPAPNWGDMTKGGGDRFLGSILGGLGGDMGGMFESLGKKIDGFLQFFKDLAAALAEALGNLHAFGAAITAFAELAAAAAKSVTALLQMQPQSEGAPQESEELTARRDRFKGLYKRSPLLNPLSQEQHPTQGQPTLLDSATQGIQLLIDKFEPILQKIHDLVQQCLTALVLIQVNLISLPGTMPKQEEKGFFAKAGDWLMSLLAVIVGGIFLATKAAVAAAAAVAAVIVGILATLAYFIDFIIDTVSELSLSANKDGEEKATSKANATNHNEYSLLPYKSRDISPEAAINPGPKFVWPGIVPLSAAAPIPPNAVTENTNNYYNCYNDQTVSASVPSQIATPDLIAERIARELRTLGTAFNYAVQG